MPRKVRYIHPVCAPEEVDPMRRHLEEYCQQDTDLSIVCLSRGVKRLDYGYYQASVGMDILAAVKKAEQDGCDAAIIGCFDDPFLREAKEISGSMAVVGLAESALHLASVLGDSFGIVCVEEKDRAQFRNLVRQYGCDHRFVSIQPLGLSVPELQKNENATAQRMEACVRKLVEEQGAEVVVLGCSMMFGFYKEMQERYLVPIIDSALCALKFAEYLANVAQGPGWRISRRCAFQAPPKEEMQAWGLE